MLKNILHLFWLVLVAIVAILFDFMIYALTSTCANCATFSQFLASPYSLFTPVWLSIIVVCKKIYSWKH